MNPKRTQATPEQVKGFKKNIEQCWVKLSYKCLPPEGVTVLVRFRVAKEYKTYTGKFLYGEKAECLVGGMWPFPLCKAKDHRVIAWMPVP